MTTSTRTTVPAATTGARIPVRHRALGWAAAAGTLPYLGLKTLWISGSTVGATDASFLADPVIRVMNVVTLGLDVIVVVLAFALTHRWGDRLPAWLVLLPVWVGTGFLVPMAVAILPVTLLSPVAPAAGPFASWVQPVVYGGFAWQGVFLLAAFRTHVHRRWHTRVTVPASPSPALEPVLRVVAAGGVATAALSAVLHLVAAATAGGAPTAVVEVMNAVLAGAGAAGVVALVRRRARGRWLVIAAAWTGSAAMFSWGLWASVVALADTPLGGSDPLTGAAQLTGLLGGFAVAVAGLLALAGAGGGRVPSERRVRLA